MTIKLTCGDGVIVRLAREHFEKSVFNNPEIAVSRSYTLRCKARSEIVNAILDRADGESQTVTITKDNFEELKSLCKELGFRGLDQELRAFRGGTGRGSVDLKEFLQLRERVTRQDKRLTELEHQLNEVLSWKRKAKSASRQFQSIERKVDEVARVCEERNVKASRKTQRALRECAKQRDLEELARDLAQLKGNGKKTATKFPPKTETPAKRAPTLRQRREFVYDSSEPFEGVIAHLTRECGGNVHDKGIVNVTGSSVYEIFYEPKNAADLGTNSHYFSRDEDDAWICYDFKERRVIPTSYSVRSGSHYDQVNFHIHSWVIEVSNDGSSWTEIDCREHNYDLDCEFVTANFKISKVPSESFRFFRLKQTGRHQGLCETFGNLRITSLEIFGTLFEK